MKVSSAGVSVVLLLASQFLVLPVMATEDLGDSRVMEGSEAIHTRCSPLFRKNGLPQKRNGNEVTESFEWDLGKSAGQVLVEFRALMAPDELRIVCDGNEVGPNWGRVSGMLEFRFNHVPSVGRKPNVCQVEVTSDLTAGVAWAVALSCPR